MNTIYLGNIEKIYEGIGCYCIVVESCIVNISLEQYNTLKVGNMVIIQEDSDGKRRLISLEEVEEVILSKSFPMVPFPPLKTPTEELKLSELFDRYIYIYKYYKAVITDCAEKDEGIQYCSVAKEYECLPIKSSIETLEKEKKSILELLAEKYINLDKYSDVTEIREYWRFNKDIPAFEALKKGIYYAYTDYPWRRRKRIEQEKTEIKKHINFLDSNLKEQSLKLNEINLKWDEKSHQLQAGIDTLLADFDKKINSDDFLLFNSRWKEYLDLQNIYKIPFYSSYNVNNNVLDAPTTLGFYSNELLLPESVCKKFENQWKSLCYVDFMAEKKALEFFVPLYDFEYNIYLFKAVTNSVEVSNGIQSYLMRLLSFSKPNSYDFILMDPISNGKSFNELIALVHDDGYGITNSIYCDKNEISVALLELSNKIKTMNQTIKGYNSIFEYTNATGKTIRPTILVAYNFCDEYYSSELLKPIFENAKNAGIKIFIVEPHTGDNHREKVSNVVDTYLTCKISVDNSGLCINSFLLSDLDDSEEYIGHYKEVSFNFCDLPDDAAEWIDDYNEVMKKGVRLKNNFKDVQGCLPAFYSLDSTNGIHIPFAVNSQNEVVNFNLAANMCYHAFVSGSTGMGKSVLLHSIISQVIRTYHPDDVELWLIDYKAVEFYEYTQMPIPHIKLIGLDRSKEFTKSFLDKLFLCMEERKKIIMSAGLQNIKEYKKQFGKNSMPRILLVIDEAHVLSQHLTEEYDYKQLFENMLSEYRAFGLSIILSDQAFMSSMNGITEKGKNQIGVRVAMKNSRSEIESTLDIDSTYYRNESVKNSINTLSIGDAIYRWNEALNDGSAELHLDRVKAIYTDRQHDRDEICTKAIELARESGYLEKHPWIVIGKNRLSIFNTTNPFDRMSFIDFKPKKAEIILGTPSSLEPYHSFEIKRRKCANMILVSEDENINLSIAFFTALNFRKEMAAKIYIFAAEDKLNEEERLYFTKTFHENVFIAESMSDYNSALDEIKSLEIGCLILWCGIDEILDEMEMLETKPQNSFSHGSALDDLFADQSIQSYEDNSSLKTFFNRSDEIIELLEKGSAFCKYSLLVLETMKEIAQKRFIKTDFFEHKFAHNISSDESNWLFGKSRTIEIDNELRESTVIYSDGLDYNILRPYNMGKDLIQYFEEGVNG